MKTCQTSVQLDNVKKAFGSNVALDIEQFKIEAGSILGLVGNNGAGKTTMFRVILDLLKPEEGKVSIVTDETVINPAESEEWKSFTGAFIDSGFLIDYLTPEEYFAFICKIDGISKEELDAKLARFADFMSGEIIGQKKLIRNLSAGNQQKVGILAAMLRNPQLLILDEPFNFLDPSSQMAMKHMLEEYNKQTGATILVSSHNLSYTLDICTHVALLEHGKIIKDYPKSDSEAIKEIEEYFMSGAKVYEDSYDGVKEQTDAPENVQPSEGETE